MPKKTDHLTVRCTCCEAVLTVHRVSGEVLFTEKPKKKGVSFDDALQQVHKDKETADDRFREAFRGFDPALGAGTPTRVNSR